MTYCPTSVRDQVNLSKVQCLYPSVLSRATLSRLHQANGTSDRYIKTKIPPWRRKLPEKRGQMKAFLSLTISIIEDHETYCTNSPRQPLGLSSTEEKDTTLGPYSNQK
jgi:hypothetical protein